MKKAWALVSLGLALSTAAFADSNGGQVRGSSVGAGTLSYNFGQVRCVAAINADGTVANVGQFVDATNTSRVSTGQYQVAFRPTCGGTTFTAKAGFARIVQVDTLQTGTAGGVYCTTADRSGVNNAVWVDCRDQTGTSADASFFLFLLR